MQAKLSAELFSEIVTSLKSDSRTSRSKEHRTEGRVGLRSNLDLILCAYGDTGEQRATVWVRDVSIKGMGFVCSTRIAEGVNFIAQFTRESQPPVSILYEVRYCGRIAHGLFGVGARLERVMADASGATVSVGRDIRSAKLGLA